MSRNSRFSRIVIALICSVALVASVTGCGGNQLQSITVNTGSNSPDIVGIGGTIQFVVTANYSNTSTSVVTTHATYTIAPPNPVPVGSPTFVAPASAVTINASGIAEAVQGACTWTATTVLTGNPPAPTTVMGTNPYIVTVSYGGMTATQFVSVNAIAGCPAGT